MPRNFISLRTTARGNSTATPLRGTEFDDVRMVQMRSMPYLVGAVTTTYLVRPMQTPHFRAASNNRLTGGGAGDTFRWGAERLDPANADTITDYNFDDGDKIDLHKNLVPSLNGQCH